MDELPIRMRKIYLTENERKRRNGRSWRQRDLVSHRKEISPRRREGREEEIVFWRAGGKLARLLAFWQRIPVVSVFLRFHFSWRSSRLCGEFHCLVKAQSATARRSSRLSRLSP